MDIKENITHFLHPHHVLTSTDNGKEYTCNGCYLPGKGDHYCCKLCDFDLHLLCAVCPTVIPSSDGQSQDRSSTDGPTSDSQPHLSMTLIPQPERSHDGTSLRRCDGCMQMVEGMFYHTEAGNFDLHPSCFVKLVKQAQVDGEMGFGDYNERGLGTFLKKMFKYGLKIFGFPSDDIC